MQAHDYNCKHTGCYLVGGWNVQRQRIHKPDEPVKWQCTTLLWQWMSIKGSLLLTILSEILSPRFPTLRTRIGLNDIDNEVETAECRGGDSMEGLWFVYHFPNTSTAFTVSSKYLQSCTKPNQTTDNSPRKEESIQCSQKHWPVWFKCFVIPYRWMTITFEEICSSCATVGHDALAMPHLCAFTMAKITCWSMCVSSSSMHRKRKRGILWWLPMIDVGG